MILYARKKLFRDDRLLQLMLLLSLLRGSPDQLLNISGAEFTLGGDDLSLGPSLGHLGGVLESPTPLHPKSVDRMLQEYQRNLIDDLSSLGGFPPPCPPPPLAHRSRNVTAYLLNCPPQLSSSGGGSSSSSSSGTTTGATVSGGSGGSGTAQGSSSNVASGSSGGPLSMPLLPPESPPEGHLTPLSPRSPVQHGSGASIVEDLSEEVSCLSFLSLIPFVERAKQCSIMMLIYQHRRCCRWCCLINQCMNEIKYISHIFIDKR